jgi:hypothetical protein
MLDAAVHQNVRFLDVIMSDILHSHHRPFTFTYLITSEEAANMAREFAA